jgi:hypothetical protein
MRLYHGTSESAAKAALRDGLKPRGKRKGNWVHSIESCPDAVYLTDAYALHYAMNATGDSGGRVAILEVDSDMLAPWLFAPDEDWLEQATRKATGGAPLDRPMKYRTRWYRKRLLDYSHMWEQSMKGLGNCTFHGTIAPTALTRVAYIDPKTVSDLIWVAGMDPIIHIMNYHVLGEQYRRDTQRIFGENVDTSNFADAYRPAEAVAARNAMLVEIFGRIEVATCD